MHKTSSLEFPQGTGFVERAIQIIKETLRKSKDDDDDPYLAILGLRTNKNSSCISTSELLMKGTLQTLIPLLNANVKTKANLKKPTVS